MAVPIEAKLRGAMEVMETSTLWGRDEGSKEKELVVRRG